MATSRFSLTLFWPTYSTSFLGRNDSSRVASSSAFAPATTRLVTLFLCQNLKGALERYFKGGALITVHSAPDGGFGHRPRVTEVFQRRQNIRFDGRLRRFQLRSCSLSFNSTTIRSAVFLPTPGIEVSRARSPRRIALTRPSTQPPARIAPARQ